MAEMKHTNGPWQFIDATKVAGMQFAPKCVIKAGDKQIASFSWNDNSPWFPTKDESQANACLIAAAPDLLSIAIEVREACLFDDGEGHVGVSEDVVIPSELFNRLCAAINKATPEMIHTTQGLSEAASDVLGERSRQMHVEGWTPEHDDTHSNGEMASAAAAYAIGLSGLSGSVQFGKKFRPWRAMLWPWDLKWWKPSDRRRDLVKAAALIIAEIERLDRAASKAGA